MTLAVNDTLSDWTAPSTLGDFSLAACLKQADRRYLVLYFYPKDDTPGCTDETAAFAQAYPDFQKAGVEVVGVSRDSLESHKRFAYKVGVPFALLSDSDEKLCTLFDVIKPKKMFGKDVRGIERSTFVVDAQGVIQHVWRGVKVLGHVEAVKAALSI